MEKSDRVELRNREGDAMIGGLQEQLPVSHHAKYIK